MNVKWMGWVYDTYNKSIILVPLAVNRKGNFDENVWISPDLSAEKQYKLQYVGL